MDGGSKKDNHEVEETETRKEERRGSINGTCRKLCIVSYQLGYILSWLSRVRELEYEVPSEI